MEGWGNGGTGNGAHWRGREKKVREEEGESGERGGEG